MDQLTAQLGASSVFATSNRLLSLPAEIRNRIFGWALTTPSRKLTLHANKGPNGGRTYQDFNQVKFTCRQLYLETRGLELKHNIIVFSRDTRDRPGPAVQLIKFLEFLPPHMVSWFQTVELESGDVQHYVGMGLRSYIPMPAAPESFSALVNLARVCKLYPNITVRYILPSAVKRHRSKPHSSLALRIFKSGIFFTYVLRGLKKPPQDRPLFPPHVDYQRLMYHLKTKAGTWMKDYVRPRYHDDYDDLEARLQLVHDTFAQAKNLRFWMPEGDFDEKWFRGIEGCRIQRMAYLQGFLPRWEEMARGWAEDGI